MIEGIILKGIGGFYYVDTAEGLIECKARGRFRKTVGKPIVGDRVTLESSRRTAPAICRRSRRARTA